VKLGIHELNGDNNSKKVGKDKKNSWEYKYVSVARTGLRNLWLMDFIEIFLSHIAYD